VAVKLRHWHAEYTTRAGGGYKFKFTFKFLLVLVRLFLLSDSVKPSGLVSLLAF